MLVEGTFFLANGYDEKENILNIFLDNDTFTDLVIFDNKLCTDTVNILKDMDIEGIEYRVILNEYENDPISYFGIGASGIIKNIHVRERFDNFTKKKIQHHGAILAFFN
jgi:hypothetical protein